MWVHEAKPDVKHSVYVPRWFSICFLAQPRHHRLIPHHRAESFKVRTYPHDHSPRSFHLPPPFCALPSQAAFLRFSNELQAAVQLRLPGQDLDVSSALSWHPIWVARLVGASVCVCVRERVCVCVTSPLSSPGF